MTRQEAAEILADAAKRHRQAAEASWPVGPRRMARIVMNRLRMAEALELAVEALEQTKNTEGGQHE